MFSQHSVSAQTQNDTRTTARQVSLSFIVFWSLLRFMSIELVTLSNHLVFWFLFPFCLQSFPASGSFPMSGFFTSGGQSIRVLASASVLPMNIQDWFRLRLTVWSPCSPRDSQESSPAPQFKSISSLVLSLLYGPTFTSIHDYWKNHSFNETDLCWESNVSAFQYAI